MITAWSVYRGFEIEKVSETEWLVKRNREQVYVAKTPAEARAWIDGRRDRDISRDTARAARKRR